MSTSSDPPAEKPEDLDPAPSKGGVMGWLKRYGKWILLVIGIGVVAGLVRESGPRKVADVLIAAGSHLPLIILFEIGWIAADALAVRALLGEHGKKAPAKLYVRSGLLAYSIMIFLPAGRVGAEIVRATMLGPFVGNARAGAAAARANGVGLVANALISIPCYLAIMSIVGPTGTLSLAIAGNGLITAFLGVGILVVSRRAKVGGFLGRRFRSMIHWGSAFDEAIAEMPAIPSKAIAISFAGRFLQMLQYAVILHSVGAVLTPLSGLAAQGIHLVGAALGDMVPNQVGFNEGAYRVFPEVIGLADDPARAVSIALLARCAQILLGALCAIATAIWSRSEPRTEKVAESE